ncbi:MAG: hypothetical protein NTZ93_03435 [Candidatus Beckwithbacteria bacterium]|nr:hypothetical protein [Candidatus Beckwithbacteria bacterium]
MKKNFLVCFVLIALSVFLMRSLFNVGFPQSHDGEMHLARLANLYLAVRDHHLPPRWAGSLNYQYGYPVFNFSYYLTEFLAWPLFSLGLSIEWSLKLILMISTVVAPIAWYFFLLPLFGSFSAFIASVFALTAVYPWVNFLVRGSTGEILVWSIVPLCLLFLRRLIQKPGRISFFLATSSLVAFLLCHNISVIFGLPLLLGFSLVSLWGQSKKKWLIAGLSFLISVGLSLFFWLPLVMEQQFTIIKAVHPILRFLDHFPTLGQLFFSKWGFGFSFPGTGDGLSFNFGPGHWLIIVLLIIALIFKRHLKINKNLAWFFLISFAGFMFLSLPISQWFWLRLPFIYEAQFPWRLLLFMSLSVIFLAAFVAKAWPRLSILVALVAIVYAGLNVHSQGFIHAPDMSYFQYPFTSTTENEYRPQWFETDKALKLAQNTDRVFNADKSVVQVWQTQKHLYTVTVPKDQPVFEKTAYFPGWEVTVDGQPAQIIYDRQDYPGLIGYNLTAGTHTVISTFTEHTPARQLGDKLSLVSLGLFTLTLFFFSRLLKYFS